MTSNNELVFDSSTLTTFERCPRLFYWRYVRHLAPLGIPIPLSYGSALHEALYTWHKTRDEQAAIQVFHENWTDLVEETVRTRDNGEILLRGYFKKYRKEPFKIISLEKRFNLPLGDFMYCGRFDGIVQWDDEIYVVDHKHTTRLTKNYFKQYRPNLQISGYVWAARKMFDLPIEGAIINLIHITKSTVKNVDTGEPFTRAAIAREDWEISIFENVAQRLMRQASSLDKSSMESWPMCWTACNDYGGCSYRDLCTDRDPEKLVDSQFEIRKWSPLDESNPERAEKNKEIVPKTPFFIFTENLTN